MKNSSGRRSMRCSLWLLAMVCGPFAAELPAQLVPKNLGSGKAAAPARPEGAWRGTAQETLGDGSRLEYALDLEFRGTDEELRLTVNATAKVPADGRELTVKIAATYAGTFREKKVAMRSETIDVRVVETGETVPAAAQRVEATLVDGVLQGRVGSEQDGWTTFVARKLGAEGRVAAAPALAGRWRGTTREPGPDGRELAYQVTVELRGGPDDLQADVAADVPYPTQDGGTTPVEYRATFRGRVVDGELQLRSEKVQLKLVALGQTQQGPQQQIVARLVDGVLRGEVRAAGEAPSRFELRAEGSGREANQDVDRIRDRGNEVERIGDETVREPVRDDSRIGEPTDTTRRRDGDGAGAKGAAYPTLVLQRQEITDPGLGGVTSHTLLVPEGWQFTGGPRWTGDPNNVVTFSGEMRAPDAASLHFLPDQAFRYSRSQTQQGVFEDPAGQTYPDGTICRIAPNQPGEVVTAVVVPMLRPGASDVRIVNTQRLPALEEAMRALLKPQLDMYESLVQQSRANQTQGIRSDSRAWLGVERTRVRYVEDGTEWEEDVQCSLIGFRGTLETEQMRSESGNWVLSKVRTVRAKAGQLDTRVGVMGVLADSVRETPRWSLAVGEIKLEIAKAKTEGMRRDLQEIIRRGAQAAQNRSELSDMQMSSWRSQQDSLDRVQKARVDALGERQDFRSSSGDTWTVTNHYDRAFKNGDDAIILTNDPNYRPAADARVNQKTWEEMQRIDPFRR